MEVDANVPLVQVKAIPSSTHVLQGAVSTSHVLFQIKTGKLEQDKTEERAPLNLAIVLDRSGSMQGNKLNFAKEAIVQVIKSLEGSKDILHLIVYGSKIETIFENAGLANIRELITKVNEIRTEGSTNLWGGLERGIEVVQKSQKDGLIPRIFLFSDGLVNQGVQDKSTIFKNVNQYFEKGIQVSAFGLGDDFDEELMKGISENGGGAYFFIEGSATIPAFVSFALKYVLKMVGKNATLKLDTPNANALIKRIYGHDSLKEVKIGDLRQENTRTILIELEIRPLGLISGDIEILHYDFEYLPESQETAMTTLSGTVRVKIGETESDVANGKSDAVAIKVVIQQTADIDKELVGLMDAADYDEDGEMNESQKQAIELLEKQIELFKSVEDADEALGGENKIKALLKEAKKSLKKMREEGVSKKARKEAHHRQYTKSRG